jgi:hypothetical protein
VVRQPAILNACTNPGKKPGANFSRVKYPPNSRIQ